MIKKIALSLFVISTLFAVDIVFDETIKDEILKEKFTKYWEQRSVKRHFLNHKTEMPYQQFLMDEIEYEDFFSKSPRFEMIKVNKILKDEKNHKIFALTLYQEGEVGIKREVFLKDNWYNIEDVWYHKFYDSRLPKFN